MCRWGCPTTNTTFMCKWCGTWFCRECLRGAFRGTMSEPLKCRICNQRKCQGTKVDFLIRPPPEDDANDKKGGKSGSKSASSARGRSASPSKSAKSAKSSKGGKSGGKKAGKKSGKKKKKK